MKKKILCGILFIVILASSCTTTILDKNEYEVVDTIYTAKNIMHRTLDHDVIIKYDNSFYYGTLSSKGELIRMDHRKIDLEVFK